MTTQPAARTSAQEPADSRWLDRIARVGFCARGVVYGVTGLLGLEIALKASSPEPSASKDGALHEIAQQPFGHGLLIALAVGLAAYTVWRVSEVVVGDEPGHRLHSVLEAVLYLVVLVSTVRFIRKGPSAGGAGGDQQEETLTARLLDLPLGQIVVGLVGVGLVLGGLYIVYRGLSQRFTQRLDTSDMGPVLGPIINVVGTLGLAARGLVFSLMGFVAVKAAVDFDPEQSNGVDGTLKLIADRAYGEVLLAAVAIGLVAYALYSLAEARYRQL